MLSTKHHLLTVRALIRMYNEDRLNLTPAFQRKSVWSVSDRRHLMVSVFNGIPLPTVYLYRRVDPSTGFVAFDVIDGKQRIETLLLFAYEGPLAEVEDLDWLKFRGDLDGREETAWWHWEDLAPVYRKEYKETRIPVIEVDGQLSEVTELFVSINSTGRKLTGKRSVTPSTTTQRYCGSQPNWRRTTASSSENRACSRPCK